MDILEVEFATDRVEAMRQFYGDRLGLPVVDDHEMSFTVRAGTTDLSFVADDPPATSAHVAFRVDAPIESVVEWLDNRVPVYRHEGFTRVGDIDGRLLVTRADRRWFPTGARPAIARTHVTVRGSEDATYEHPSHPYIVTQKSID